MASDEFWRAVGHVLREARIAQGIAYPQDVKKPSEKTVRGIERGEPGHCGKLDEYAGKLGLNLTDIFRSVLAAMNDQVSADAMRLARAYDRMTFDQRRVLRELFDVLKTHQG